MQVGELTGPDAISAAGAVDDAIHQYATERAHLVRQLSELDALLAQRAAEARTAAAARVQAPAAPAPQPAPQPTPPRPAPRPSAAVAAPPLSAPPHPGAPAATGAPAAAASPRPSQSMPQAAPASGSFDELAFLSTVVGAETVGQGEGTHAPSAPAGPQADAAPAAAAAPVATATPPGPAASAPAPTVQPMARLKPLGAPPQPRASESHLPAAPPPPRPSAGIIRDDGAAKSLLDGIGSSLPMGGERPLAANDPANTPIVLRTSGSTEQSKTLRCAECGAMNYPTEWYCERCGAELAAL